MYTGGFSPRGAGGRGLKRVGKTLGAARCTLNGLVRLGCPAGGPGVLGRQGDTGTGPAPDRSLSQLSAVPTLLDRGHRATVEGGSWGARARTLLAHHRL